MSKSLRLSEKWFRRGLWLVAFLFAWFLTGLGSTLVGDLPQVEQVRTLDDFMDPQRTPVLRQAIKDAGRAADDAQAALDQAQLRHQTAQASNRAARETFSNWLATRQVTQKPEQDSELIARTKELDALRQDEREALAAFLDFARQHKEIYRIIDEAEFADPAAFRSHYETTAGRIAARFDECVANGTMAPGDNELRAWAVMGMNVFLGLRYGVWAEDKPVEDVAAGAEAILRDGIARRE